jgi:lipocalin-like protein
VFAYCGTYQVRESEGRVIHRPEFSSAPSYVGTDQPRNYRLEGDVLTLSAEEPGATGKPSTYRIIWQRVPAK